MDRIGRHVIASLRHSLNLQNQASIVMVLACGSINALMAVLNGSSVLIDMASDVRWGSAVSPV